MSEISQLVTDATPVVAAVITLAITVIGFGIGSRVIKRFVK